MPDSPKKARIFLNRHFWARKSSLLNIFKKDFSHIKLLFLNYLYKMNKSSLIDDYFRNDHNIRFLINFLILAIYYFISPFYIADSEFEEKKKKFI